MKSSDDVTAASLQLDGTSVLRYMRFIVKQQEDDGLLRIYEHRNGIFSVHGPSDVALSARLHIDDLRTVAQLHPPAGNNLNPLDTLTFNSRKAKQLASAALFSTGKKVQLLTVAQDGRCTVTAAGSPGNLATLESFLPTENVYASLAGEDEHRIMDAGTEDCTILAVKIADVKGTTRILGITSWDSANRCLSFGEVNEDDFFSGLEAIIVATNAKEVIFCEGEVSDFDSGKIADVFNKCGVAMTTRPRREFSTSNIANDLERLVGSKLSIAKFLDMPYACSSCAALLLFSGLSTDMYLEGKVIPRDIANHTFLQMDNAALRALNVLPVPGDAGKKSSLYGLLNCTKTPMGSRLLRRWLQQPLQDIDAINKRLDIVRSFEQDQQLCTDVRQDHLKRIPDIAALCRRFTKNQGKRATLEDVVKLYQCSARIPLLAKILESCPGILVDKFGDPLNSLSRELANFEALVETSIDLDQIDNGEFVINPAIDPRLAELRRKQDNVLASINTEFDSVGENVSDLKLERKDNIGYVFRVTRKNEKQIRGRSRFTVLETRKDGIRFRTQTLRRLSEEYDEIASDYNEHEKEFRDKALNVAGTYIEVFVEIAALVAELDVLSSFAFVALGGRNVYCRPSIVPPGQGLVLKQGRHPIVEENMDDAGAFISNDIDLRCRQGADDGGALLLVTGPNMGGKSTYIRTAGVITLLAHIGAFVPAQEARVPLTDRILARVGAGDNQHRAISTFMAEMLETASILRAATCKSLIIIDELGRGTGTMDGFGLAHAISSHIATSIKASCLFATHFYELTALADKIPEVRNYHVTASVNSVDNRLTFLYDVQPGACDKSFGVHVAQMAHFPSSVVATAKRKAAELENNRNPLKKLKISPEEIETGQGLVTKLLADLKNLQAKTNAGQSDTLCKAKELRERIMAKKNAYVKALLTE